MVKLNKIYTRTGDDGTSGLVDGSRAAKSGVRLTAIGEVDEANCAVGLAIAELAALTGLPDLASLPDLRRIQNELFDLGADLATPFGTDFEAHALRIVAPQVERIEREIDAMNADLAPLASFILPSGSRAIASVHLARAIVRRAERAAVALAAAEQVNHHALAYINRLSDHLFVLARVVAARDGGEVLWQPGATRGD